MAIAFTIITVVLIICGTIAFVAYMDYCDTNGCGLFPDMHHEKRIRELERTVDKLEDKINGTV